MDGLAAGPLAGAGGETTTQRLRRLGRFFGPALPWWSACAVLWFFYVDDVVAASVWWTLVAVLGWAVLLLAGVMAALGYRAANAAERAAIAASELCHLSTASPEALTGPDGTIFLDSARCRWHSSMFRSDALWRLGRRAVFFFRGRPDLGAMRTNVVASRCRSLVVVPGDQVRGQVYVR